MGHARSQLTRKTIVLGNEEQIKKGGVPDANFWALIRERGWDVHSMTVVSLIS